MKLTKIIALFLVIATLACAFAGCGSEKSDNGNDAIIGHDKDDSSKESEKEEPKEVFRGKIDSVSVSDDIIVARTEDGKAFAIGGNTIATNLDVSHWDDIIAVSAGGNHALGLKSDGTVVSTGNGSNGQRNTSEWKDIVAIHAGLKQSFGLKSDGTVVMTTESSSAYPVEGWKDIVSIAGCGDYLWGLDSNGDVYVRSKSTPVYSGVKSIECNAAYAIFLKDDGTVAADPISKNYDKYYTGIEEWTDIVDVDTLVYNHVIGLKADGTVVAVGQNEDGRGDVTEWTDIVAIATGSYHTVGLRSDGTVVATGGNGYGQCDVSDWKNIVAVYASDILTVGLKEDGTIVAAGQVWNGLDGIEKVRNVATK